MRQNTANFSLDGIRSMAAAVFAVLLALPAMAQPPAKRVSRLPARPNVLLITVDTLRADRIGAYGATNVFTPAVDALAKDGILFERALAQVPLTLPSHAGILTGMYPFSNGVQDFTGQPLGPQFRTIAQSLKQNGYATGAIVSSFVLDRSWGLSRGFDFYFDMFAGTSFLTHDLALVERKGDRSTDRALEWLGKNAARPFFLWLHLYDPHSPYDPPEPFRSQYAGRAYDGEVAFADAQVGRVMEWLKKRRLYDNTLIILAADHGESLGEHGENEHGFFIYNSTVHVPLIVKPPARPTRSERRIKRPVEILAIAPTIVGMLGIRDEIQKQFQAPSLLEPTSDDRPAYSETFYPFSSFGWSPLRSLQTERYQYIDAPKPELYDLVTDPGQKENLVGRQAAVAAVLKQKLAELQRRFPAPTQQPGAGGLDAETIEKLGALGYVGFRTSVTAEQLAAGLADPKDRVWEFNTILRAIDLAQLKEFEKSRLLLEQVREKEPNMYVIPFMLGEAALQQEDWVTAARELQRCLELNPNFDQAMTAVARALHALNQTQEGTKWLDKALKLNPQNTRALYQLGWMQLKDDPDAAARSFQKVIDIQPHFALARRDLGILRIRQQRYVEAAQHLAEAYRLGLNDYRLLNFLGIAYGQTGQTRKAVGVYRTAIREKPDFAEAHLNLAAALERLKQTQAARAEYEEACRLESKFCQYVPR
ncbi:MAG TPA: sulfatase-like hydrolase/transferase [Terriglobales bacterium]|nr:sulfatase-like hydrolase/transferase [Terriglobales bacterium]